MSANSITEHSEERAERRMGFDLPRVEYLAEPSVQCHSTEANIKHSEDDGAEVSSKMAPSPKKTLWGVVKEFFQKRRGSFANLPPLAFF